MLVSCRLDALSPREDHKLIVAESNLKNLDVLEAGRALGVIGEDADEAVLLGVLTTLRHWDLVLILELLLRLVGLLCLFAYLFVLD